MKETKQEHVGKVIFFAQTWGFIEWYKDGKKQTDMFVHFSDILYEGFKTLKKNQRVCFEVGKNREGRDKAVNVVVMH